MTTETATAGITISCAKAGCHWTGTPADAPGHLCPTEAAAPADAAAPAIPVDADPQTRPEIEEWLLEHGDYSEDGIPQDERTATLDARLTALQDATPEEPELVEGEVEPELDPPEPLSDEAAAAFDAETARLEEIVPRPWETVIAEALETQTRVAAYRWLVIGKPYDEQAEAELIGRGTTKAEADELVENVLASATGYSGELAVVKTADVLEAAAEIERKRELVEDDPVAVPASPEPPLEETPPAEETPEEPESVVAKIEQAQAAQPPEEPETGSLFDAEVYEREDLQIPKVDGHQIDRIALDFSGSVMLDRSEVGDVELYNGFPLFKERELWISAKATGTGAKGATNREGDLDVVMGRKSLKVESVRIVKPEELGSLDALESLRMVARRALRAGVAPGAIEEAVEGAIDAWDGGAA